MKTDRPSPVANFDDATQLVLQYAKYYREAPPGYQYAVRWNGTTYAAGDTHKLVDKVREAMEKEHG